MHERDPGLPEARASPARAEPVGSPGPGNRRRSRPTISGRFGGAHPASEAPSLPQRGARLSRKASIPSAASRAIIFSAMTRAV